MRRWIDGFTVAGLVVAASAGLAGTLTAQEATPQQTPPQEITPPVATLRSEPLPACAAAPAEDPFLAEVSLARDLEDSEAAKAALAALEPEARRTATESPNDPDAQYRLAAVLGARLDHEHGSDKMSGAEQLRDQADRVLALDPEHAGASYMLGKLHASVLRMSGFKRFMAKSLFGGSALNGASWEEAQRLLEVAAQRGPCVPEHHLELARVYGHVGDEAGAEREFAYVRELTAGRDGRQARVRARAEELEREWRDAGRKL